MDEKRDGGCARIGLRKRSAFLKKSTDSGPELPSSDVPRPPGNLFRVSFGRFQFVSISGAVRGSTTSRTCPQPQGARAQGWRLPPPWARRAVPVQDPESAEAVLCDHLVRILAGRADGPPDKPQQMCTRRTIADLRGRTFPPRAAASGGTAGDPGRTCRLIHAVALACGCTDRHMRRKGWGKAARPKRRKRRKRQSCLRGQVVE